MICISTGNYKFCHKVNTANNKKSLKIPKENQKQAINRRRTDNVIAKRTNNDLQNTTQKN